MARTQSRRAAIANGAKTYFTGKPCKYGHTTDRYTRNGMCVECCYQASTTQRQKDKQAHEAAMDERDDDTVPEPIKQAARARTNKAIKKGELIPLACEVCGDVAEAHHPDYSQPDVVQWLCVRHHNEFHRLARGMKRLGYRVVLARE